MTDFRVIDPQGGGMNAEILKALNAEIERLRVALDGEIREKITRTADYEAELQRCREALRECVRLSGADLSGGFPTWPELPEFAVQEVRQLREDSES